MAVTVAIAIVAVFFIAITAVVGLDEIILESQFCYLGYTRNQHLAGVNTALVIRRMQGTCNGELTARAGRITALEVPQGLEDRHHISRNSLIVREASRAVILVHFDKQNKGSLAARVFYVTSDNFSPDDPDAEEKRKKLVPFPRLKTLHVTKRGTGVPGGRSYRGSTCSRTIGIKPGSPEPSSKAPAGPPR
ncbi:hypothetical protein B0T26DRAFT_747011 [Lasiosphaeria miniovina]|uniref:Uncharacterized protein n=1 Tax=Lasiosphaeria miniovina TaxID=1954250 RepID=A0AA40EB96_9PEZI|nr:uncharacterized protein B0T26DRAFT_747011 [Lasiosphaeria miniovina]KAK0735199.1 hypothetical protein B0T26DRAFT_747011 [Lasiosphaeria miniovina]